MPSPCIHLPFRSEQKITFQSPQTTESVYEDKAHRIKAESSKLYLLLAYFLLLAIKSKCGSFPQYRTVF